MKNYEEIKNYLLNHIDEIGNALLEHYQEMIICDNELIKLLEEVK